MLQRLFIIGMILSGLLIFGPPAAAQVQAWGNGAPIWTRFVCSGLISCTPTAGASVALAVPSSSPTSSGDITVSGSYPYSLDVNAGLCLVGGTALKVTCAGPTNTPFDTFIEANANLYHGYAMRDNSTTPGTPGPCASAIADYVSTGAIVLPWPSKPPLCNAPSITGDGESSIWFGGTPFPAGTTQPNPALNVLTMPTGVIPPTSGPIIIAWMQKPTYNSSNGFDAWDIDSTPHLEFSCLNNTNLEAGLNNASGGLSIGYSAAACISGRPTYFIYRWTGASGSPANSVFFYINGLNVFMGTSATAFTPGNQASTGFIGRGTNAAQSGALSGLMSKFVVLNGDITDQYAYQMYYAAVCGGQPVGCVPP
jgi:hypothetical protein